MGNPSQPVKLFSRSARSLKPRLGGGGFKLPEGLRSWLDCCLVPPMVREYLEIRRRVFDEEPHRDPVAESGKTVSESRSERTTRLKEVL